MHGLGLGLRQSWEIKIPCPFFLQQSGRGSVLRFLALEAALNLIGLVLSLHENLRVCFGRRFQVRHLLVVAVSVAATVCQLEELC